MNIFHSFLVYMKHNIGKQYTYLTWATPLEAGVDINVRHLHSHVPVQWSHVSDTLLAELVWWMAGGAPLGVRPGIPFTAQA
jgi:hypothetical protein